MKIYDFSKKLIDKCHFINLDKFEEYLTKTGWKQLMLDIPYLKDKRIYQYFINTNDFIQIDIPLNVNTSDYYKMVLRACYTLSEFEHKDLETIFSYFAQ